MTASTRCSTATRRAGVGINLATGRGVGGSAEGDTLISIENVFGSNFNDTLTGTSGANQLHGQDGNDVIKGGGGNDFLDGGSGNDILVSGIWATSILDGGAGDDTFKGIGARRHPDRRERLRYRRFQPHELRHDLAGGPASPTGQVRRRPTRRSSSASRTSPAPPGQDVLVGNGESNVLRGLAGQDNLIGGGGADIMYGGADNDHYYVDNAGDLVWE